MKGSFIRAGVLVVVTLAALLLSGCGRSKGMSPRSISSACATAMARVSQRTIPNLLNGFARRQNKALPGPNTDLAGSYRRNPQGEGTL